MSSRVRVVDITPAQARYLCAIRRLCEGGECTTFGAVARAVGVGTVAAVRVVDTLQMRGLVSRQAGRVRTLRPREGVVPRVVETRREGRHVA